MKVWQKDKASLKEVEMFTVGKDREMDMYLASFDVLGSLAHIQMLESVGLLTKDELTQLQQALRNIYQQVENGDFTLQDDVEDIHSQVELLLTHELGDVGKKIHAARSRNDQVLVDIKLFLRKELEELVKGIQSFFELLQTQSEKYKDHPMAAYAQFVRGVNAQRTFKTITPEKLIAVREPDYKQGEALLGEAIEKSKGAKGLDNITLNQAMQTLAKAFQRDGNKKAAEATVKEIISYFTKLPIKEHVKEKIRRQSSTLLAKDN